MDNNDTQAWLARFPALDAIDDPVWREAAAQAQRVQLPADTFVFHAGSPCQSYLLVLDGSVRVQKVSESGKEIVLYRVESGQSCILTTACLLADEHYQAEAVTESAVDAIALPFGAFQRALAGSPAFRRFVFASYGRRVSDLVTLIDAIAFGRVDSRLARRLLELAESDDEVLVTHQELARDLGTAREVVSRLLKEFERAGLVALRRGCVELRDRDALTEQAEPAV